MKKHTDIEIIKAVGAKIAAGHGVYRPKLKADDFKGTVIINGYAYKVSLRWPNGAEAHEITAQIKTA
jgi:hypothetical protein